MTYLEAQHELLLTLAEIEKLDTEMSQVPDAKTATRLSAAKDVALRLGQKVEEALEYEHQIQVDEQREATRRDYEAGVGQLDHLYSEAAEALEVAIESIEEAFELKAHVRQDLRRLKQLGGAPSREAKYFWERFPKLKNSFVDSVLRNGEP